MASNQCRLTLIPQSQLAASYALVQAVSPSLGVASLSNSQFVGYFYQTCDQYTNWIRSPELLSTLTVRSCSFGPHLIYTDLTITDQGEGPTWYTSHLLNSKKSRLPQLWKIYWMNDWFENQLWFKASGMLRFARHPVLVRNCIAFKMYTKYFRVQQSQYATTIIFDWDARGSG